jgi:hypothetical protein
LNPGENAPGAEALPMPDTVRDTTVYAGFLGLYTRYPTPTATALRTARQRIATRT